MPKSFSLLSSDKGTELLPEICLRVAEFLIDSEPTAVGSLLLLSKSFNILLKSYEKSITKTLSQNDTEFEYVNVSQTTLISSRMPLGDPLVRMQTYAWYSELRSRRDTIEFLINHEITEMMDLTESWPILDVPKSELRQRLIRFKRDAFLMLYKLADCTASHITTQDMRMQQLEFLESLTPTQLASLGVMVEVIGQNYFTITKRTFIDSGLPIGLHLPAVVHPASTIRTNVPSSAPIADLMNDNWVRECMCVFEDLVQRFGPYFAWAYLEGSSQRVKRRDLWARAMLQEGLDNMNAFELGYTMSYASLQSVVWRVFCKKEGCSSQDRWNTAKDLVEIVMSGYKIER